jgi:hypothetical protein
MERHPHESESEPATRADAERILAAVRAERELLSRHGRGTALRHEVMIALLVLAVSLAGFSVWHSSRVLSPAVNRNYRRILSAEATLQARGPILDQVQAAERVHERREEAIEARLRALKREMDAQDRVNQLQTRQLLRMGGGHHRRRR